MLCNFGLVQIMSSFYGAICIYHQVFAWVACQWCWSDIFWGLRSYFKVSASPAAACLWQRDDQGTHLKRWKKSWVMILLSSRISNITIRSLWLGVLVRLMNKYVMAVLEVQFLRCKIKVFFPFDFGLDFDFDSNNLEQRRVPHHSESSFNHASDWGQKKTLSVGPLRVHSLPASFYLVFDLWFHSCHIPGSRSCNGIRMYRSWFFSPAWCHLLSPLIHTYVKYSPIFQLPN